MISIIVKVYCVLLGCLAISLQASCSQGSTSCAEGAAVDPAQAKADRRRKMKNESKKQRRIAQAQKLVDAVKTDEYGTTIDHEVIREATERANKERERKRNGWKKRVQLPEQAQEVALNHVIRNIARDHRKTPKSDDELKKLKAEAIEKSHSKGISTKEHLERVAEKTFTNYTPRTKERAASKYTSGSTTM